MSDQNGTVAPVKGKRGRKRNVTFAEGAPKGATTTNAAAKKTKKKAADKKKNRTPSSLLSGTATNASKLESKTDQETEELIRTFERELEFDQEEEQSAAVDEGANSKKNTQTESAAVVQPPKTQINSSGLGSHVQLQGGNFETTIIQVRKRSDRVINGMKMILQDPHALNNGRQTIAECLLVMEEMARHLVNTQTDFERTIRQLKCRAWTGSVNDTASESLGPYALAPTWR